MLLSHSAYLEGMCFSSAARMPSNALALAGPGGGQQGDAALKVVHGRLRPSGGSWAQPAARRWARGTAHPDTQRPSGLARTRVRCGAGSAGRSASGKRSRAAHVDVGHRDLPPHSPAEPSSARRQPRAPATHQRAPGPRTSGSAPRGPRTVCASMTARGDSPAVPPSPAERAAREPAVQGRALRPSAQPHPVPRQGAQVAREGQSARGGGGAPERPAMAGWAQGRVQQPACLSSARLLPHCEQAGRLRGGVPPCC